MFLLYHVYNGNKDRARDQVNLFKKTVLNLSERITSIVNCNQIIPDYRRGHRIYKDLTPLHISCIQGDAELVETLVKRFGADLNITCKRKNRFKNIFRNRLNSLQNFAKSMAIFCQDLTIYL